MRRGSPVPVLLGAAAGTEVGFGGLDQVSLRFWLPTEWAHTCLLILVVVAVVVGALVDCGRLDWLESVALAGVRSPACWRRLKQSQMHFSRPIAR